MAARDTLKAIQNLAQKELTEIKAIRQVSNIASTVVFPTLLNIWGFFFSNLGDKHPSTFWLIELVIVGFQIIFAIVASRKNEFVFEAFFKAESINDELDAVTSQRDELISQVSYDSLLKEAILGWDATLLEVATTQEVQKETFEQVASAMLGIIVDGREAFFGFAASELWNFALYEYREDIQMLVPIWRKCHHLHPAYFKLNETLGREWKRGQGHVGISYSNNAPIITSDAQDHQITDVLVPPPDIKKAYDDMVYISYAVVPIHSPIEGEEPIGILVATSDTAGRFDKGNSEVLRHAASVLSNVKALLKETK